MSRTIPSAPTVRAMIYQALAADPTLLGLLGAAGMLPQPGSDPRLHKRPFLYIRREGDGRDGDGLAQAVWAIEIHYEPSAGPYVAEALRDALKAIFHRARWAPPTQSSERPRRSWWAGTSGELPDAGFGTSKLIARFTLTQS